SPTFARKGGVIVFAMKGLMSDSLARKLALEGGIGVRYGCHCAHILIKHLVGISPSLEKFQRLMATLIPAIKFPGLARVSLGIGNSEEDVDTLIRVLDKIAGRYSVKNNKRSASSHEITHTVTKKDVQRQIKEFSRNAALRVYSSL
ncbi:MAG: aminotransferase class V-fold PLP-dependent enzyme, partial [Bacteroidales bacterium]|nr:aminotransferase class V-fold PLP-dependent enzyme [Bacteroidales bacterium]